MAAVRPLLDHADAEVRRRAAIAAADWAADEEALAPVIRALADASPDVRAGAAHGLARSRVTSPAALRALVARVEDEREDRAVREQAWRALARYPLDDRAHAVHAAFAALLEADEEARPEEGPAPASGVHGD
jgi:HEAT repeat protein